MDFHEAQVLMKYENTQVISDVLRVQGGPREGVSSLHYYRSES